MGSRAHSNKSQMNSVVQQHEFTGLQNYHSGKKGGSSKNYDNGKSLPDGFIGQKKHASRA